MFGITKVIPPKDRIVVKRLELPEKTKGGIFLPDSARDGRSTGVAVEFEVLRIGKEFNKESGMGLKVGDVIYADRFAGLVLLVNDKNTFYLTLGIDDILAKKEEK